MGLSLVKSSLDVTLSNIWVGSSRDLHRF